MKEQILNWLKHDRSYNTAVSLYHRYGTSLSLKAILNRQGETVYNTSLLTEELRKLAGIDQDEMKHILSLPLQKIPVSVETEDLVQADDSDESLSETVSETEPLNEEVTVDEPVQSQEIPAEEVKKKASLPASEKASDSGKSSRS